MKALDLEDIAAYRTFAAEKGFGKILAHAPYTMNACAADEGLREFAANVMACLLYTSRGEGYVMEVDGQVRGYACISFAGEPCYNELAGKWLSDLPYGVVHRMAIDDVCKGKGAAPAFFRFAEELCRERDIRSIRVDTDADNRMMQRVLEKQGFTYCGTVCFDNSEKIAFEKLL